MIQAMQDSILERLRAQVTGLAIEAFPDDPQNYQLKHPTGAALVRYQGASFRALPLEYGALAAADFLNHPEAMSLTWRVNLMMRALKGNAGIYQKLDEIRACLTGFKPTGGQELFPTQEGLQEQNQGVWIYYIQFRTQT